MIAVVHWPPLHTGVCEPHFTPQPPQLFASLSTSTHALPHHAVPTPQQWPCVHHSVSVAHAVLQLPQWSWKFCVS